MNENSWFRYLVYTTSIILTTTWALYITDKSEKDDNSENDCSEEKEEDNLDTPVITCNLCYQECDKIISICGNSTCTNYVCVECINKFYKGPEKGKVVVTGQLLCPLCREKPKEYLVKVLRNEILHLINSIDQMETKWYYGWCQTCDKLEKAVEKNCAQTEVPDFNDFECDECTIKKLKASEHFNCTKPCPNCGLDTYKTGGCNRIVCSRRNCRTVWCYVCGFMGDCSETVYTHMKKEHDGLYFKPIDYNLMISDKKIYTYREIRNKYYGEN